MVSLTQTIETNSTNTLPHTNTHTVKTHDLRAGLVDTRENSATATQLDRHGVSMVWRPSLQEKLIKYQRLYSEGLCWRAAASA